MALSTTRLTDRLLALGLIVTKTTSDRVCTLAPINDRWIGANFKVLDHVVSVSHTIARVAPDIGLHIKETLSGRWRDGCQLTVFHDQATGDAVIALLYRFADDSALPSRTKIFLNEAVALRHEIDTAIAECITHWIMTRTESTEQAYSTTQP